MNSNKKFEAYKLVKNGEYYKICNIEESENENEKKTIYVKKIKNIKKISKSKTIFQKMKEFIKLNLNFSFIGKETSKSFILNSLKFENLNRIYNFLFSNDKKINKNDLIKLKKIYILFNSKQLKKLTNSVKLFLSK